MISCNFAWNPLAEAMGPWRLRLRTATWRWSRHCWPPAPPSRRRTDSGVAPRDGTDATGRTWWEGGATGEKWKRCDTPLSLLPVLRNFQCTLRDSMLRSQLPVDSSCKFVLHVTQWFVWMSQVYILRVLKFRGHFAGLVY